MSKLASFFRNVAGASDIPNEALLQHYSQQRRALLKRLALAVKQIQLEGFSVDQDSKSGSQATETSHLISDGKAADHLLYCFEAILEHGLSHGVLSFGRPSFWPLILKISRKQAVQYLSRLRHVTSVHGRCRAWLRLAANEDSLQSYILVLCQNTELLREHYDEHALMLDEEQTTAFCSLLTGINNVVFNLTVDNPALEFEPTPEAEPSDKLRLAALQLAQADARQQSTCRSKRRRKQKEKTSVATTEESAKNESAGESSSDFDESEEVEEDKEIQSPGELHSTEQNAVVQSDALSSAIVSTSSSEQHNVAIETSLPVSTSGEVKAAFASVKSTGQVILPGDQLSTVTAAHQASPPVLSDVLKKTGAAQIPAEPEMASSDDDAVLVARQNPGRRRRREHRLSTRQSLIELPKAASKDAIDTEQAVSHQHCASDHVEKLVSEDNQQSPKVKQLLTVVQQVSVSDLLHQSPEKDSEDGNRHCFRSDDSNLAVVQQDQVVATDDDNILGVSRKSDEDMAVGNKGAVAELLSSSSNAPVQEEMSTSLLDRYSSMSTDSKPSSVVDNTTGPSEHHDIHFPTVEDTTSVTHLDCVDESVCNARVPLVEANDDTLLAESGEGKEQGEASVVEVGAVTKNGDSNSGIVSVPEIAITETLTSPQKPQSGEEQTFNQQELFDMSPCSDDSPSENDPVVLEVEEVVTPHRGADERLTVTAEPAMASSVVNEDFCAGLLRHHHQTKSSTPLGSSSESSDDEVNDSHVSGSLQSHGRWIEASVRNEVLSFESSTAFRGPGTALNNDEPREVSPSQAIPGADQSNSKETTTVGSFVVVGSHFPSAFGAGGHSPLETQLEASEEEVQPFQETFQTNSVESTPMVRSFDGAFDGTASQRKADSQAEQAFPSELMTTQRLAWSPPIRVNKNGEPKWHGVGEASVRSDTGDASEEFTMLTLVDVSYDHFSQPDIVGEHATVADLEFAIERRKQRFTTCAESEREELVAEMVRLRLRLLELVESEHSDVIRKTVLGHKFVRKTKKPGSSSRCDRCGATIWRMVQPWYRCEACRYNCHGKCLVDVSRTCAKQKASGSLITEICPVRGLGDQQYMCFECRRRISLSPRANHLEARLCDYTGKYYCPHCHWNDQSVIPARVVHNWDFTPRKVCRSSLEVLSFMGNKACLSLDEVNPLLFNHVDELIKVKEIREEILVMKNYFVTCQTARTSKLLLQLVGHQHYVDTSHMYSLRDLVWLNNGVLLPELQHIASSFVMHIKVECEVCRAKGFNCELCSSDETIFHFDHHCTSCTVCQAVYHRVCFKKATCPRCHRRQSRKMA